VSGRVLLKIRKLFEKEMIMNRAERRRRKRNANRIESHECGTFFTVGTDMPSDGIEMNSDTIDQILNTLPKIMLKNIARGNGYVELLESGQWESLTEEWEDGTKLNWKARNVWDKRNERPLHQVDIASIPIHEREFFMNWYIEENAEINESVTEDFRADILRTQAEEFFGNGVVLTDELTKELIESGKIDESRLKELQEVWGDEGVIFWNPETEKLNIGGSFGF